MGRSLQFTEQDLVQRGEVPIKGSRFAVTELTRCELDRLDCIHFCGGGGAGVGSAGLCLTPASLISLSAKWVCGMLSVGCSCIEKLFLRSRNYKFQNLCRKFLECNFNFLNAFFHSFPIKLKTITMINNMPEFSI